MKTLDTIQKTCKVFLILAQIAMGLSFVWAALTVAGVVCCAVWQVNGAEPGGIVEEYLLSPYGGALKAIGVLLADFVFGVTDGLLFWFAARYLKRELADGTPFTIEGANQVKSLGIKTIVMPLVAIVVAAIIYACFGLSQYDNVGNGVPVVMGIALLLVSLILRHGAELRQKNENDETPNI